MANGIASLRGYQEGGPLSEFFRRLRESQWWKERTPTETEKPDWYRKLRGLPSPPAPESSEEEYLEEYGGLDNPYYAFMDTLQSIIGSGGRGAQGDVSVQYGPVPPWAQAAGAPGWYDPELPLEKEEHQLPPFLNILPQSTIEPLGRLLGMDKERVYLRDRPPSLMRRVEDYDHPHPDSVPDWVTEIMDSPKQVNEDVPVPHSGPNRFSRSHAIAAHEFGHAFDFRNIISNELENKIIEEYYENPLTSPNQLLKSAGYPDSDWEDDLPINILGHTEKFAQVFGEAVEFLQRLHDEKSPNLLAGQNVTGIGTKYGRPLEHTEGWGVPPYMFTMVQELLKLPHYKDHPLNETHIERDAHSTAWPIVKRHPSLLAQQDVTGIRGIR